MPLFTAARLMVALTVFFARVLDVSLGTLRHAMIIRGKKAIAMLVAFAESLIWVYAVSRVLSDLSDPLTALSFAGGFAAGTFTGMSIENLLKIGDQAVRVFTAKGEELAHLVREAGFRVTSFDGSGRDGPVTLLYVQAKRREVRKILALARSADPSCYLVVDDIRVASRGTSAGVRPSGKV
ncbi:MAG: hypothetical protein BWY39_00062 [Spirochaetes bacterium ADurb.Bin269]|nr:MAG: hypothetical protein BWY39_00062 [Spirochaetes bacterium ADurb.Bin269]